MVAGLSAALVLALHPSAQAHHRPKRYCSSSGDICQSVTRINGVRKLRIRTAARYFRWFHLCVRDPDGFRVCAPFKLKKRADGTFGRSVRWRKHFGYDGPGAYTVSWRFIRSGDLIGRRLGFHVGD
jgi:hypothetical protein